MSKLLLHVLILIVMISTLVNIHCYNLKYNIPLEPRKHQYVVFKDSLSGLFHELVRKRRQLPKRKDLEKEGFLPEEKEAMLLLHNSYRSAVVPTATNMIEVTWDNDIEAFAQEWANVCGGDHRPNRNLNDWINMGENLYWWTGGKYDEKRPVEWWFNERNYYNFDDHECQEVDENGNSVACGHYITVVWAKTEKIGCGIKRCDTIESVVDRPAYYFVCNYSGRFLSKLRPFEQGTSCSNCPAEFPKCRYNLCVSQSMFDSCQGYNGSLTWAAVERATTQSDAIVCAPDGGEGEDAGTPDTDNGGDREGDDDLDNGIGGDGDDLDNGIGGDGDALDNGIGGDGEHGDALGNENDRNGEDGGGQDTESGDGDGDGDGGDGDDGSGVSLVSSLTTIVAIGILAITIISSM